MRFTLLLLLFSLTPTVTFSQELDEMVENAVTTNPEIQLLQSRIKVLDSIQPYPLYTYLIMQKLQSIFYQFPVTRSLFLHIEKEKLQDELEALKLGIAEEVIGETSGRRRK